MVVRMLKTYTTGYATEILWYLYYIPLLLIPTFYYNCSSYLINSKNKKKKNCHNNYINNTILISNYK